MAFWILAVSSLPPPRGLTLAQTVVRFGMSPLDSSPTICQFGDAFRSAGRRETEPPQPWVHAKAEAMPSSATRIRVRRIKRIKITFPTPVRDLSGGVPLLPSAGKNREPVGHSVRGDGPRTHPDQGPLARSGPLWRLRA